jgi:drug/metabolite transporter (DMT)-like permease
MPFLSAVLGLLAGLANGTSSVLQREGALETHSEGTVGVRALRRLVSEPVWVAGIAVTLLGAALQAAALATGPIALVQPLLTLELPWTLLLGGWVFASRLDVSERWAIVGMVAGLCLLVVALAPSGGRPLAAATSRWLAMGAVNVALIAILTLAGLRRLHAVRAALLGVAAGACFALTAALIAAMTAAVTRSGVAALASTWQTYAFLVAGPVGFFLLQDTMRAGRLAASQPGLTLTNPLVSLAWGILVFGERVRGGPWIVAEVAGALSVAGCTVLLARSPLLHGVPSPGPEPGPGEVAEGGLGPS